MRNRNLYLTLSMIGIILTAITHLGLTLFFTEILVQQIFFSIYPIFILLLLIGFRKMLKEDPSKNINQPY